MEFALNEEGCGKGYEEGQLTGMAFRKSTWKSTTKAS